ncbi:CoA-transferase [Agrobacterium vitis]
MKVITSKDAADLIQDDWRIITGGFGCCGSPDTLLNALGDRFTKTGCPRNLRLLFASGVGDKAGKGLDRLAQPGLLSEAIGGFWGFCPGLTAMARQGLIEGHNWPQGLVSKLFSAVGAGETHIVSKIGLGTFIDPRIEGGMLNPKSSSLVSVIGQGDEERLSFPALPAECCLLRGTSADGRGNISMVRETSWMDAIAQAIAVKNRGGIVVVQVEELVDVHLSLGEIRIPGMLVDYVVLSECGHPATYGRPADIRFSQPGTAIEALHKTNFKLDVAKQIVVGRAFEELKIYRGTHVNLGIGVPALLGAYAKKQGFDDIWMTVESGVVGGVPEDGLAFGAAVHPEAIIDQPMLFNFYHGGGIKAAFLGFGEVDVAGNVNVSRFGDRLPGAGGFIDISQSADNVIFCGTLTTKGLAAERGKNGIRIVSEGSISKLVQHVQQVTFSAERARAMGQNVIYITERAVFRLGREGLELTECYAGIDPEQVWGLLPTRREFAEAPPPDTARAIMFTYQSNEGSSL